MSTKLYIGNLAQASTEQEVRDLFSQAGEISSLALIADQATGHNKGFGFVEMSTDDAAQDAIKRFDGYALNDKAMVVSVARPRVERAGSGPRR